MRQVVVIHGGDAFNSYDEYLAALRAREVDFGRLKGKGWKSNLEAALGSEFEVIALRMPCPDNAKYLEWKIVFEKYLPCINDGVIFVCHSLGGIFLAKYFSEEHLSIKARAVLLVAAPYNTGTEHPLADFVLNDDLHGLSEQSETVILYQSVDDTIVPVSNFRRYEQELPQAKKREFTDRGHFLQEEFPELVEDIRTLVDE